MKTIEKLRSLLLASAVATLLLGVGCSDDGDENPNPGTNVIGGTKNDGGSGGKGNTAGKGGSTNPEGGSDSGTAGSITNPEGGSAPIAGSGGEAGSPPVECPEPTGADGCFNCPSTDLEYLNRCADGDCVPFDNKRLTKLNPDGSLPDLE